MFLNAFSVSGHILEIESFLSRATKGGTEPFRFSNLLPDQEITDVSEIVGDWVEGKALIEDRLTRNATKQVEFKTLTEDLRITVLKLSEVSPSLSFTVGSFRKDSGTEGFGAYAGMIVGGQTFIERGGSVDNLGNIANLSDWHAKKVSEV